MKQLLVICGMLALALPVAAIDPGQAFDDPELQARYEKITDEVRCLKCQNQTIKDSNAFLAGDLRREIRRMLEEGYSDDEIFDFLVNRYGDFALYSPRPTGKTLALWIGPAVFLLAGGLVLVNIVRRRMTMPISDGEDHRS